MKILLAVLGFMVATGVGAWAMGKMLAAASARTGRPLPQEEKWG